MKIEIEISPKSVFSTGQVRAKIKFDDGVNPVTNFDDVENAKPIDIFICKGIIESVNNAFDEIVNKMSASDSLEALTQLPKFIKQIEEAEK